MNTWVWIFLFLLQPLAALAQEDRLCFVQFIHPGLEHEPDSAVGRSWNVEMHRRKFLRQPGRCLAAPDAKPVAAPLVFWGEYEPPTTRVKSYAHPVPDGPRFLFAPAPVPFHPNDPPLMKIAGLDTDIVQFAYYNDLKYIASSLASMSPKLFDIYTTSQNFIADFLEVKDL